MKKDGGFLRTTAVAAVVLAGAWLPGNGAWAAGTPQGDEEPWYQAWLQVAADTSVPIRDTLPSLHWRTDMDTLYRGDTTDQGLEAFQVGLLPKAVNFPENEWMYDWFRHGAGAGKSVYSSTTRSQRIAQSFAKEWVFEFKAPHGIDQEKSGGAIVSEEEISFPGGVKGRFIKQACKKNDAADCVPNQAYREPTGQESRLEVAAMSIDWSQVTPPEGLAWVTSNQTLWAVGSSLINPVQGAEALAHGLRAWNSQAPNLRLGSNPESPVFTNSIVVAFRDYTAARNWAVADAQNGGWVYEVKPNSVAVDLSGPSTGGREGAVAFIGGIKSELLLGACRFEKGASLPAECVGERKMPPVQN